MHVKLDMDGVIVNFTKGACKVLHEPYPETEHLNDYGWLFEKHGEAKCYSRIKGHLFWTSLEKFPWADELIDIVDEETKGDWIFLTKPMLDPWCYSGKAEWVMKHYRKYLNKLVILNGDKELVVRSKKDYLIDDHPKNIKRWADAGGSFFHWTELGDLHNPDVVQERLKNLRQELIQIRNS